MRQRTSSYLWPSGPYGGIDGHLELDPAVDPEKKYGNQMDNQCDSWSTVAVDFASGEARFMQLL
jgi:hypothetical protein